MWRAIPSSAERVPTLSVRLAVIITFAIILVVKGVIVLTADWVIQAVDERSLARQIGFVERGISERYAAVPVQQESSTIWDEAVVRVKAGDQEWIEENLGLWMGTYFGHNRVYVLNESDDPVHAMIDETTLQPSAYEPDRYLVAPLIKQLREAIKEASYGLEDSTPAIAELGAQDFVMVDGLSAIMSVKPIIPSLQLTQTPGSEFLHVSVVVANQAFADAIGRQYDLEGSRLSPPAGNPSRASVPIRNQDGEILSFYEWEAYQPGALVLSGIAPTFVAGSILLGGLLAFLLVQILRSSRALETREREARYLAFHDPLTGLPNRALFDNRLEHAIGGLDRPAKSLAVMLIDVDRFKHINDTYGHPAGDALVREMGERLAALARAGDTVARLGGDEFGILLTAVDSSHSAEQLAERILADTLRPFDLSGEQTFTSVSVGIVICDQLDMSASDVFRKADIALYEAKTAGRNRHSVFQDGMDDILRRRRTIEQELRAALDSPGAIKVAYQPLFSANGKTIVGAEALVRWEHPVHGNLSPATFVAIAEERGLIARLGEFVLEEACRVGAETGLPWIAVNVSPVQLRDPRFADTVFDTLGKTGLPPAGLQLEITENALIEDADLVRAMLHRLRSAGVRISLDDFGTGYSSMNHLRDYPIDKIKIDRSFVSQLGQTVEADAIIRAMVTLARAMKKRVAAEGVQTVDQRDHLAALGCHELQGFLLSRPLTESGMKDVWAANDGTNRLNVLGSDHQRVAGASVMAG